jgi:putative transposase
VWPVKISPKWIDHVNRPQTEAELETLRRSVVRGMPYGNTAWQARTAKRLGLESTLRARGRPPKKHEAEST